MRVFTEVALASALQRVGEGEFDKDPFIKNLICDLKRERDTNAHLAERVKWFEDELAKTVERERVLIEAHARYTERMRELKAKIDAIPLEELPDV